MYSGRTTVVIYLRKPVTFNTGSFGGGLTKTFGCRKMVMTGFLLAAVGSLACAFVNNLAALVLMFGVVSGRCDSYASYHMTDL